MNEKMSSLKNFLVDVIVFVTEPSYEFCYYVCCYFCAFLDVCGVWIPDEY